MAVMDAIHIKKLGEYFVPGRILYSEYWKQFDRVISFNTPASEECFNRDWSVTVAQCDQDGNLMGEPREHFTDPLIKR